MITIIVIAVLSYLIGSFPTSIVTGKILRGIDIREHGSGNAGATNVFRVLGWKPGVFVMLTDILKGFAAAYWVVLFIIDNPPIGQHYLQLIAGACAVIGHIWTVFAGFKGGKGVGTAAGMLLALFPIIILICIGVFALMFLATRIVSVASISAAASLPILLTIFKYVLDKPIPMALYVFGFVVAALIIYTHRSNIKRLMNGTENRFGKKKS